MSKTIFIIFFSLIASHNTLAMNITRNPENGEFMFSASPEIRKTLFNRYAQLSQDELLKELYNLEKDRKAHEERLQENHGKLSTFFMIAIETYTLKIRMADYVLLHSLWPDGTKTRESLPKKCSPLKTSFMRNKYSPYSL